MSRKGNYDTRMRLWPLFAALLLVTCDESTISGKWCFACDCGVHHPGKPVPGEETCECPCGNG
jgi:hypothetical protein